MKYFNGTAYNESAKSAENDYLHLLAQDNGTFTVSHKESGRVFFEMPTLLIGKDDTFAWATAIASEKSRDAKGVSFHTLLSAATLYPDLEDWHMLSTKALLSAQMLDKSSTLAFTLSYERGEHDVILRFPSGIYNPTVIEDALEVSRKPSDLDNSDKSRKITLTDEDGQIFRLKTTCKHAIFTVTDDGNLDVKLPLVAPTTEKTRHSINFIIEFAECSVYK